MSNTVMRLLGILSQDFVDGAGTGAYIDGAGLWLSSLNSDAGTSCATAPFLNTSATLKR
jgi:hypothetical protein